MIQTTDNVVPRPSNQLSLQPLGSIIVVGQRPTLASLFYHYNLLN